MTHVTDPSAAAGPVVALRDVSKVFANGTEALRGLTLDVARGEFLSLLGPSGCGKTTALRLMAGLAAPSAGRITWAGGAAGPARGEIGFVFQEPTLMPWARVFDNVRLPLKLQHVPPAEARARVLAALADVGLAEVARAFPRELSGGMKMRVAIARALVTRPRLLLMDEPFAALDEITRQRLNDDVLRLWAQSGITVVFVTHSVFESAYLARRIVVLRPRPGRVVEEIALDDPGPRDAAWRTSEAYRAATARVAAALQRAMSLGGEDGRA
jgi:NitT/TauT family transport system ATP-binding protein